MGTHPRTHCAAIVQKGCITAKMTMIVLEKRLTIRLKGEHFQ
ncbi:hypothetical protein J3A65_001252 [Rhizobium sp. PvP014]|nr:hypothetical protein [Rhizobium sp. PvP014]MBP2527885.1 hypothetical protein [Rhizobium sp. PvP099]